MCSRGYFKPTYSESMATLDFKKSLLLHIVNKLSSSYYEWLNFFPGDKNDIFFYVSKQQLQQLKKTA